VSNKTQKLVKRSRFCAWRARAHAFFACVCACRCSGSFSARLCGRDKRANHSAPLCVCVCVVCGVCSAARVHLLAHTRGAPHTPRTRARAEASRFFRTEKRNESN
jgi:hypothetical protein